MIGTLIKKYLDENRLDYSFVAKDCKIEPLIFEEMLKENRKIKSEEYYVICNVLKVKLDYFYSKWKS